MKDNNAEQFEEQFMREVENRIQKMENESYEFPKRFSKKDYIVTAIVIFVCLAGVIGGAFIA